MGNEYGEQSENLNNKKELLDPNYKGPSFFLNKNYPNDDNLSLEEILRQYLEVKNYSFNNNENININNQIEENSLTPKFNAKNDRTNIKVLNISSNSNNDQKDEDQIININNNTNSKIKDHNNNIIPSINNSNININININIDIPKNKKSQSIIKTLQNS